MRTAAWRSSARTPPAPRSAWTAPAGPRGTSSTPGWPDARLTSPDPGMTRTEPVKRGDAMGLGGAVILFAVGAILRFATNAKVSGIDLQTIGVIIMVVSAIWFVAMLAMYFSRRRTTITQDRRVAASDPA